MKLSTDRARLANLLGALGLAVADELERAAAPAAPGGARGPAALALLRQYPGQTVEGLRGQLAMTHSGAVRLVDRLAGDGLVERRAGGDRRSVALHLTRAGQQATDRALAARAAVLDPLVASLPDDGAAAATQLIEQFLTALTPDDDRGSEICRLCDLRRCPLERCPVERAGQAAA